VAIHKVGALVENPEASHHGCTVVENSIEKISSEESINCINLKAQAFTRCCQRITKERESDSDPLLWRESQFNNIKPAADVQSHAGSADFLPQT
jgi:hypothetical protein